MSHRLLSESDAQDDSGPKPKRAGSVPLSGSYLHATHTRNGYISSKIVLSRLASFAFALILAAGVLIANRYDVDDIISMVPEEIQRAILQLPDETISDVRLSTIPATPARDYVVCTRHPNGIYTVEESDSSAMGHGMTQCLAVDTEGTIVATGGLDAIKRSHPHIRPKFLPKRSIVVPGLVDSHAHVLEYGWSRTLNLDGAKTIEEVVTRVRDYVLRHESSGDTEEWIDGVGWDQNKWEGWPGGFPTHEHLDADPVLRGKPIVLYRTDLHVVWVSGRALELCGTLPSTVEGGEIVRDAAGNPTGIFVDLAQFLIPKPAWTTHQMREFFQRTATDVLRVGLTALHDAMSKDAAVEFYKQIAEEGSLPFRLHLMANRDYGYWGDDFRRFDHYGQHRRLHLRSVKLISDGAIGSWGAVMYEPYSDNPASSGLFVTPLEDLQTNIPRYLEGGWQVNVHCIGDRANGEVLDIFENASRNIDYNPLRPRIEHAQIFRPQDIARVGQLGLIASIQPKHATSDMVYADARLGERAKSGYVYRSLIDTGARIAMGSDFPVESPNPLVGFHAAVTRVDANGTSPQGPRGWYPAQKITRYEALKGMTLDAAYASFTENETGSLVVGKKADFVVLDQDIMTVASEKILDTRVLATVVDGVVEYGSL